MKHFAFINTPSVELERPPAAAAVISACAKSAGWTCDQFDFNLYLNHAVDSATWQELEQYWRCKRLELSHLTRQKLDQALDDFINDVVATSPDMVGVTVFSRMSVMAAWLMLQALRPKYKGKIVIGGSGSYAWPGSLPSMDISSLDSATFADYAHKVGLVDYYIQGDGEEAFIALINGNDQYPGINGIPPIQIENLNALPHPDYTGIEPANYFYTHEPGIYITASRGCVRKCSFCNIPEMWPKFKNRTADDVAQEIINSKKKFGVNLFHFTDSLVNGNMKVWRDINHRLRELKQTDPVFQDVKYMGQFICRTRFDQSESDWELMWQAGANLLVTGIESFSPSVRKHMGKHYSNSDIDFHFKMSAWYGIKNVSLMFIGYPTETQADHEYNIEFLHRYRKYALSGIIHAVRWGYTGMFRESEKLEKRGGVKIITDPDFAKKFSNLPQGIRDIALGFGWINELNPDLDLRERIRRRLELHEISVKLGWPQTRSREELQILYNILENLNRNQINGNDFEELETLLDFH
jgi:hypothetical protein